MIHTAIYITGKKHTFKARRFNVQISAIGILLNTTKKAKEKLLAFVHNPFACVSGGDV